MEKTIEFKNIKDFGDSKEIDDKNIDTLKLHYDRDKKKYITTIIYGKKA